MTTPTRDPIADAAQECLTILGENTTELIDEVAAEISLDDRFWENAGSVEAQMFVDDTFARVCRALAPLLIAAADAADKRTGMSSESPR